jgi:SAM-dependent methyltransferase
MSKTEREQQGYAPAQRDELTRYSAEQVLSIVFEYCFPRSVVDVGCGVGTWLSVCRAKEVSAVFGVDGSYVDASLLQIPQDCFKAADLAKPINIGRSFDLAISLEVAEHLPSSMAETFVRTLIALAPVILFSAAVPRQGGFRHVNEQWPSYWVSRFAAEHYLVVDAIRPRIWNDDKILYWYRQNSLIFVRQDVLAPSAVWREARERTRTNQLDLIHPELWGLTSRAVVSNDCFAACPRRLWRSLLARWRTSHAK